MICPGCERPKLACLCSNEAVALHDLRLAVRALVRSIPPCGRCQAEGRAPALATHVSCLHDDDDGRKEPVCEGHSLVGDTELLGHAELLRVVDLCPAAPPALAHETQARDCERCRREVVVPLPKATHVEYTAGQAVWVCAKHAGDTAKPLGGG